MKHRRKRKIFLNAEINAQREKNTIFKKMKSSSRKFILSNFHDGFDEFGLFYVEENIMKSTVSVFFIHDFETKKIPISFSLIDGNFYIENFTKLNTLKGLVDELTGNLVITFCPKLDSREIEICQDFRLRKLWNESILNLDQFYEEHRGIISSRKFGF
jgi:hypothetical protein